MKLGSVYVYHLYCLSLFCQILFSWPTEFQSSFLHLSVSFCFFFNFILCTLSHFIKIFVKKPVKQQQQQQQIILVVLGVVALSVMNDTASGVSKM